jgi:hypothetical protein
VELTGPDADQAASQRVELRMTRQRVLYRVPDPMRLVVVLDEGVLLRAAGGNDVMADQLRLLAERAALPNVELHVLPLRPGVHLASMRSFSMVASNGAASAHVVCIPDGTGVRYDETPDAVGAHGDVFAHLRSRSLSAAESVALIHRAKENYL